MTNIGQHYTGNGIVSAPQNKLLRRPKPEPATIPDPDAELIETVAETLYRTNWPSDLWDGLSIEAYRELALAALTAIRAHDQPALFGGDGR